VDTDGLDEQIAGVASLKEPMRRALYQYVVEHGRPTSRDEAAQATGMTRALAAFHLDKLAEDGLLEASYQRLTGRTGPGAGRPSKLYARSNRQIDVSFPPRSYVLVADMFARALAGAAPETRATLSRVAHGVGEQLGDAARDAAPKKGDTLAAAERVLTELGFEPFLDGDIIRLRNCPFHALATRYTDLVCGTNLALMQGLTDGLKLQGVVPILDPGPGRCCVAFKPSISPLPEWQR